MLAILLLLAFAVAIAVSTQSAAGAPGDKLYWTDPVAGKIQRADLDGSNIEDVLTGFDVFDIEIDNAGAKMYWSGGGDIRRANLDGTAVELVVAGGATQRLALDLVNGKLYWASGNVVRRANLDGSAEELVLDAGSAVYGVGVDPDGGKVYLTTENVFRADLDGTGLEQIAATFVGVAGDVDLDLPAAKLYWIDLEFIASPGALCVLGFGVIRTANLDGTSPVVLSGSPAINVVVHGGDYYWAEEPVEFGQPFCGPGFGSLNLNRGLVTVIGGISPSGIAIAKSAPIPTPNPVGGIARGTGLAPLLVADEPGGSATPWVAAAALAGVGLALGGAWLARRRPVG